MSGKFFFQKSFQIRDLLSIKFLRELCFFKNYFETIPPRFISIENFKTLLKIKFFGVYFI